MESSKAKNAKAKQATKVKNFKKTKVRFLIPLYKYFHPLKQIYFMDMIFPLDIKGSSEEDYHIGKMNMVKNVQIRPLVKHNKKTGYLSITYDSPSIHILHNQCDYFVDYLSSLGDEELKKLAEILNSWKNLWSKKDIFELSSRINIRETYTQEDAETESTKSESCYVKKEEGVRGIVMKKLYYFERIVTYQDSRMTMNRFSLYYSLELLDLLQVDKDDFFNQALYFKHPILVKPLQTLEYRMHLLSQLLNGDFPRLDSNILFESDKKSILLNPFLSTQRTFNLQQDSIIIRCFFSYLEESDLKTVERLHPPAEEEFTKFAKKQTENVAQKLKQVLNS